MIKFYDYQKFPTCTKCGGCPKGTETCPICATKRSDKREGKLPTRMHQTMEEKDFQEFWEIYSDELYKFKMHHFQKVTNSKKFITDVRRQCAKPGSVAIQHDFTEACKIVHNREVQSNHFGDQKTVSIEGYTVHYANSEDESKTVFDFHSYLSDEMTQMACTVDVHMSKLFEKLMEDGILQKGGRVLGSTDGCAKQYKCATAVFLMTMLAHNVIV